ncbi:DUF4340 domain-containing protein [Candidatus Roizmanbacteria bacterium]|nr:DUF4340 domain-containing protein [Candidatus Roizmanbacteria bacterium]
MTRNRSRIIKLTIILIFISVILFVKNKLTQFISNNPNKPFSTLKKDSIKELLFTKAGKVNRIYKKDGKWFVKIDNREFRADEEKLNKVIDSALSLNKEEIVSNNKSKHTELGIGDQKIEFNIDGKSFVIYVGNTNGLSKNNLRIDNEDEVFVAGGFEDAFTNDDYKDLHVHFIEDENKLTSVYIEFAEKKTSLVKKGNDWKIANKSLKKDRIDYFINDLKTLKATMIQPRDFVPRGAVALIIKVKENNRDKTAQFLINDADSYNLKISGSNLIFQVPAAYVGSLKKEEKDFTE